MLDQIAIATTFGHLLWTKDYTTTTTSTQLETLLNQAIQNFIIPQTSVEQVAKLNQKTLQWTLDGNFVIISIYSNLISLPFSMEKVLEATRLKFGTVYAERLSSTARSTARSTAGSTATIKDYPVLESIDFDAEFQSILSALSSTGQKDNQPKKPRKFQDSLKFANTLEGSKTLKKETVNEHGVDIDVQKALNSTSKKQPRPFQHKKKEKGGDGGASSTSGKKLRSWDASGAATVISSKGENLDFSSENIATDSNPDTSALVSINPV